MLAVLGSEVSLCAPLGGETGLVLADLLGRHRVQLHRVPIAASNGCYVEDRRSGEPTCIVDMPPGDLGRHEMDDLFNKALALGLDSDVLVLTGLGSSGVITPDIYRRIAADLSGMGVCVVADLTGEELSAALEGGLSVLKVSHDDLVEDGRAKSEDLDDLVAAVEDLAENVSTMVMLTRAGEPTLVRADGEYLQVRAPALQLVDHRGAGDSMTAGVAAALARGLDVEHALRLGAACGAANVTRHGLASGQRDTIEQIARHVEVRGLGRRPA